MAEPIFSHQNPSFISSGRGEYMDTVNNIIDILQKAFSDTDSAWVADYKPEVFYGADPKRIPFEASPALFVYINGTDTQRPSIGQTNSSRSFSMHKNFFVTIVYAITMSDDCDANEIIWTIADFIDCVLEENLNLNDMFNAGGEPGETIFQDRLLNYNDRLCPMHTYEKRMVYKKTKKKKSSNR